MRTCETKSLRSSTRRAPTFAAASAHIISAQLYALDPEAFALTSRKRVVVVVQQLLRVERHKTLEHAVADTARADRADDLALEIVRVARDVGHLPVAARDLLVRGHEVAHEEKDVHHDVLRDGDDDEEDAA